MTLRLRNGRFATAAKVRAERNRFFHRALISAVAAFRRAGFKGDVYDASFSERVIELYKPVVDYDKIIAVARRVETARLYPDVIYNISFQDSRGKWFAVTKAWETVELAMLELIRNIKEIMERYQRTDADPDEDEEYAIVAIGVSVYKWRK